VNQARLKHVDLISQHGFKRDRSRRQCRNVWRAPRPRKLDSDEQDLQMCNCKPGTDCGDACVNRSLKIDCNPAMCVNGRGCTNRALQQRSYAKLRLFKSALCGYGMKTLEDVSPGQLVQEYVGEVVTTGEMHNRLATYRPGQPVYVLCFISISFSRRPSINI
jgi:hypothetical protein